MPVDGHPAEPVPKVETWRSTEGISHPAILRFLDYWNAKRGDRRAPSRRDIDPIEMRAFLPYILMLDVVGPEPRYRIRLMGTEYVRAVGADRTGCFAEEGLPPDHYERLRQEIDDVVTRFVLRYRISNMAFQGRPYARFHRLMLPLSDDQAQVNIVLCIGYMIGPEQRDIPTTPLNATIETTTVVEARIAEAYK